MKFGTESLARACAKRPWVTISIWAAVLAAAFLLISAFLGGALTNEEKMTNNPESMQAQNILNERLGVSDGLNEMIVVKSKTLTVDDPQFRTQVEQIYSSLTGLGKDVVLGGVTYYMTNDPSLVSADRHSTLINYLMPKDGDKKIEQVYQIVDPITAAGTFEVFNTGSASFNHDATALAEGTMKTGETIGIAAALVVLAIVFGAVVAATLPIILGIVAIIAALGLTSLVGQAMHLSFTITNMVTMMGLAVGIDYSLFVLTRFREERARGKNKIEAIATSGATASRAVLFSGTTVLLALTSLVIFPMTIFHSMGIGAMLVVLVAIIATLTLLPAVISIFGDRVNSLKILQRRKQPALDSQSGFWATTTRIVTRRPIISMIAVVAILAAAAVPFFSKNTGMSGITGFPDTMRAKKGFNVVAQEFHLGMDAPASIVIDGDVTNPAIQTAITNLDQRIASDTIFTGTLVNTYAAKNLIVINASLAGDPMAKQDMDAVSRLRTDYIPAAFDGSGVKPLVTGQTAGILDFNQTTNTYTPILFGFVLSLSFIVLMLAFRSIVIPATTILMNLLSVGAAYGLLVLVFQEGIGARLFGFQKVDVIESWLPLFLFALLFGLSMDYQVFLLSRIREYYRKNGNTSAAVAFGLRNTGKLITGAALIMVAVFGGFAKGDMVMFQEMGFGLAAAVFVDATLIRSILVPATMTLLGSRNWYLPAWLEWIPNISLGEQRAEKQGEVVLVPQPEPAEVKKAPLPAPAAD